jgi:hypothetical protein
MDLQGKSTSKNSYCDCSLASEARISLNSAEPSNREISILEASARDSACSERGHDDDNATMMLRTHEYVTTVKAAVPLSCYPAIVTSGLSGK